MKYAVFFTTPGNPELQREDYDESFTTTQTEVSERAAAWVGFHNATLKPKEAPRTLVKGVLIGEGRKRHEWLGPLKRKRGYSQFQCTKCFAFGRRAKGAKFTITLDPRHNNKRKECR